MGFIKVYNIDQQVDTYDKSNDAYFREVANNIAKYENVLKNTLQTADVTTEKKKVNEHHLRKLLYACSRGYVSIQFSQLLNLTASDLLLEVKNKVKF